MNIEIKILIPNQIEIEIKNKKGLINFDNNFFDRGPIFKELANFEFFKKAFINLEDGLIEWPNGFGIALDEIEYTLEKSDKLQIC